MTSPEAFAGPTATGAPAFLAQTNPAPFLSASYIPPQPLETQIPINGAPLDGNIYQLQGQLSHYFPNTRGFGVDEYPLPEGAEITQLHMIHRHGSRYPEIGTPAVLGKLVNNTGKFNATGDLAFLNSWTNSLGEEILVPVGNQELFDSGVLHQVSAALALVASGTYLYGHLYPNDGSKIVARTTTQDRMRKSAEYFLAGFFGLQWQNNATLEAIIELETGDCNFNNSLSGNTCCPNYYNFRNAGGKNASVAWQKVYLADAHRRIQSQVPGFNFSIGDIYDLQSLCAYETVSIGYSHFCGLFTYEEWKGYEYGTDLDVTGGNTFASPVGRAVGIGWVEEFKARLQGHLITSHDTNTWSYLTALGLKQFAPILPTTHIERDRSQVRSYLTPFGGRVDIEVITAQRAVPRLRQQSTPTTSSNTSEPVQYIHFLIGQRTVPLHASYSKCPCRDDGWCELGAFLNTTANTLEENRYEFACFGEYEEPYGQVTNGAPTTPEV
ncbi:hypothetical protein PRZ48_004227 [Zasmidium cellare]|uniref:3-phytase n=1 Tax=Zasmidium cellare TaxID=395010 RepID=A0ABR0EXB8_ZASCE|nr:hypothetical protein PRZ48_004227 [Zasmidium cellare]